MQAITLIPILLRPRWIIATRAFREIHRSPVRVVKLVLLVFLALAVSGGLYQSSIHALAALEKTGLTQGQAEQTVFQIIYGSIFVLLFFSAVIAALSALFLSKDLDIALAAPLSKRNFFCSKLLEVFLQSSWLPMLFALPAIMGVVMSSTPSGMQVASVLFIVAFFAIIPSSLALGVVALLGLIVPASRTRDLLIAFALLLLICAYLLLHTFAPVEMATEDVGFMISTLAQRFGPLPWWFPNVAAAAFSSSLLHSYTLSTGILLVLEVCVALFCSLVAIKFCYHSAYSKAVSARPGYKIDSRKGHRRGQALLGSLNGPSRGLVLKEFKIFARDMIQALQLLVLLGLCAVYLYNFQVLRVVGEQSHLTHDTRLWWEALLVFLNLVVGALVLTAVGMRFVFPAISLEGQSYWVIQTAPISVEDFLRAKFWGWFVPLASIASVIMVSGAFAIQAEPRIILVSGIAAWIFCFGIVGLGIGLGAVFANFQWEHPSQVITSVGSLLYLLASIFLVLLGSLPVGSLIILRTLRTVGFQFSAWQWYSSVLSASALLVCLNYIAARWAIKSGAAALEAKR